MKSNIKGARLFYLVPLVFYFDQLRFWNTHLFSRIYGEIAFWKNITPLFSEYLIGLAFIFGVCFSLLRVVGKDGLFLKLVHLLSFAVISVSYHTNLGLGYGSGYTEIGHGLHHIFLILICDLLIEDRKESEKLRVFQIQVLLIFFFSGLKKIFAAFIVADGYQSALSLQYFEKALIQECVFSGELSHCLLIADLFPHWILSVFGPLGAIVQIATLPLFIFKKRMTFVVGTLLLSFHLVTALVLNIYFHFQSLSIFLLFFVIPFFNKKMISIQRPVQDQPEKA